ncbi:helix-turn-helix transcriptional regulator [Pseudonocardia acidicola]|uniref:Helix-turn-helix transcriptional regulator n=1 Tax=Pseudonocardia acidicola TaxID=2724939 RepID=A0ABX1S5J4_9PSEU|nr:helix-turn-helix transcriptional regulator [Pseudonocardia acidicola]NMH96052.1 helix-turn-helix transcriptional regulator [Pseudonocardia acidicola]
MGTDRPAAQIAVNRERQRTLYGAPLGDRVHRLIGILGITQARLAGALGLSPAMLSQLVSGRRIKIGDPAVLARLMLLDERCPPAGGPPAPAAVTALLDEVRTAQLQWSVPPPRSGRRVPGPHRGGPDGAAAVRSGGAAAAHGPGGGGQLPRRGHRTAAVAPRTAADALRAVAGPAQLVAAAAALDRGFPELAEVLRQAAGRPVPR